MSYFDDFAVGQTYRSAGVTVTESMILDFALMYDPQPIHLDAQQAAMGQYGGLIASGFQTLALSFRLFFQLNLVAAQNLGSPGMDELRWKAPLRPGDTIHVEVTVVESKASTSKPDRGIVRMRHDTVNQDGTVILSLLAMHMLRRRPGPA